MVIARAIIRFAASGNAGIKPAPTRFANALAAIRARVSPSSFDIECDAGEVVLLVTAVDGNRCRAALADWAA
jgi:hypothetical protein